MNRFWVRGGTILCLAVVVCLSGCGTSSSASGGGTMQPADTLSGNWLITGTLPTVGTGAGASNFEFGMTLTNTSGVLTSTSAMSYQCTTSPTTNGYNIQFAASNVSSNGGFTLTSPTAPGVGGQTLYGMTIAASDVMSTTFNATLSTLNPDPSYCNFPQGQTFIATKLADFTGTYQGTANVEGTAGAATATVSLVLTQGGTIGTAGTYSKSAMSGTITVTGNGCSITGNIPAAPVSSLVDGDLAILNFNMSDGGTWHLELSPLGVTGTSLNGYSNGSSGGTCRWASQATTVFTKQ